MAFRKNTFLKEKVSDGMCVRSSRLLVLLNTQRFEIALKEEPSNIYRYSGERTAPINTPALIPGLQTSRDCKPLLFQRVLTSKRALQCRTKQRHPHIRVAHELHFKTTCTKNATPGWLVCLFVCLVIYLFINLLRYVYLFM